MAKSGGTFTAHDVINDIIGVFICPGNIAKPIICYQIITNPQGNIVVST